ncbi:acetyltransferase [Perkinsela sp. CCAP 1560/4]|nr:acetyltransferase [Perkinsela sp. CCAP 1560/4]|eukprot:KNH07137.1 acetyltransferase [Perkinsela sp. CCAP 1560/4]
MFQSLQARWQSKTIQSLLTVDALIKGTVFGCAGSTCMYVVPNIMSEFEKIPPLTPRPPDYRYFGDNPSLINGPWLYRVLYLGTSVMVYNFSLLFWGTVFMRRQYFTNFILRMWSRVFP